MDCLKDSTSRTDSSCLAMGTIPQGHNPILSHCLAGMKIYHRAQEEFDRITKAHPILAPTGCTPTFCQSGRATRLNEPRVGRDRPIAEIQQEAIGFLRECRDHEILESDTELDERIQVALRQIEATAVECLVTDIGGGQVKGLAGGVWDQSCKELEYGIRASWRNSRRCIMRSKFEQLTLCDLRHVTTSQQMAESIIGGLQTAFNGGRIIPTAFVFSPRRPKQRGAMIWNNNILAFAGYPREDGSILGDPINVDLTESIIELGWKPPVERSRWDVLPLVTMAEGQQPYIAELPHELKRTIKIIHPRYREEFEDLDLRWLLAPVLSRLGFDIGGNQYTASPFIGYFLDAEIGIRNLADTFRYNVLPDIVERLGLSDDPSKIFEDLPEYMKLAALSRAQAELNFAVQYSYIHERVTMIDSLTGSQDYQRFDQERKDEVGYRLPADPYWLAPPQGSIIPLWHQGGAPNYQPKPMICKHVQDPVKAWRRESARCIRRQQLRTPSLTISRQALQQTVKIFSCSAGISADKMARKLYTRLAWLQAAGGSWSVEPPKALNSLDLTRTAIGDIVLIIASTTGQGETPRNAATFMKRSVTANLDAGVPSFSVFGNGDTTYGDTYNAAGQKIEGLMKKAGCKPFLNHTFTGDTAINNPDWTSFNLWSEAIEHTIQGNSYRCTPPVHLSEIGALTKDITVSSTARLVNIERSQSASLLRVTLDLGSIDYQEMDHVKLLTPNCDSEVRQCLSSLGLDPDQELTWHNENAYDYLSRYVDLDHSFKSFDWYPGFGDLNGELQQELRGKKAKDVLASLQCGYSMESVQHICQSMYSIRPRIYSVASSPHDTRPNNAMGVASHSLVDMIVKMNRGGRFSDLFLSQAQPGTRLRFCLSSSDSWKIIEKQPPNAPLILVTTGSGIGPVRAILQRRIADIHKIAKLDFSESDSDFGSSSSSLSSLTSHRSSISSSTSTDLSEGGPVLPTDKQIPASVNSGLINLFAGFKAEDQVLINDIVKPASQLGLLDIVELVPSNNAKIRVQDRILDPSVKDKLTSLLRHPSSIIFVCGNESAADATAKNLSRIIGADIRGVLGDRYIEEIFRRA